MCLRRTRTKRHRRWSLPSSAGTSQFNILNLHLLRVSWLIVEPVGRGDIAGGVTHARQIAACIELSQREQFIMLINAWT